MSKLKVNENFFKTWSSDMAYILGLITTDGCLVEYKNGYHGLNITSKDIGLLEQVKILMCAEHKIGKKAKAHHLQIRNRVLYNDLLKLGLTPRKTKTKKFPQVPKRYLSDFIRGCFDGDGSVFIWKELRWRHTLQIRSTFSSGSISLLKKLRNVLCENAGLTKGYLQLRKSSYELKYAIADSLVLYRFMYAIDSNLHLERKKKIFESFLNFRSTNLNL